MTDATIQKLELRIQELEKLLANAPARTQATNLTADEIKAYQKVRDVVAADWGEFCGINDCFRCIILRCHTTLCITRCIYRCINECDGGWLQGRPFDGGLARFGHMAE